MNILYLCDEYPPAKTGGIGTVTKVVAEAMANRGHTVYVVSGRPAGHEFPAEQTINGVTVYRLTYFGLIYPLLTLPERYRNISLNGLKKIGIMNILAKTAQRKNDRFVKSLIREKKIDLIEKPDYTILSKYFTRPVKFAKYGVPTLIRVHGAPSFLSYYKSCNISEIHRRNDVANYLSADRICAVSEFSKKFVREILGVNKAIDVIYNPLENSYMQLDCKSCGKSRKIVFLGKVIETKGAFVLIRAFCRIADRYPDIRLVMIGGGEISQAREIADPRFRDRIEFTGYLTRQEIKRQIAGSLFGVIPSYFENFSMAAMEVMACGKTLIYTKRASGPELIEEKLNGLLVEPTDVDEIAKAMCYLLDRPDDCEKMGANALRSILQSFTEEIIVSKLEIYYQEIKNDHAKTHNAKIA